MLLHNNKKHKIIIKLFIYSEINKKSKFKKFTIFLL